MFHAEKAVDPEPVVKNILPLGKLPAIESRRDSAAVAVRSGTRSRDVKMRKFQQLTFSLSNS